MKKRYGKDNEFVLAATKSLENVESWTEKVFKDDGSEEYKFSMEVWKWFVDVVLAAYAKAENDLVRRMILVKVIHTREVVKAGYDIIRNEKEFGWNEAMVGTVCLLHDIARFDQALLGSFSDTETKYDHALVGSEMIKNKEFLIAGLDIDVVVEAVKNHSAFQYLGGDNYAKLTRDADKLALLRAMPEILESQIGKYARGGVTEEAFEAYKKGEMVLHKDMKTKADLFLAWLAWESDLNFSETKRLFIDEGIKEWMYGELTKLLGVEAVL